MPYADELLEHASRLLQPGGRSIAEADVRRAVSSAYYALFHLLVEAGTNLLCPEQPVELRAQFKRAFVHSDMKKVCKQFETGKKASMSSTLRNLLTEPVEPELLEVAKAFVDLQAMRHQADYVLDSPISSTEAAIHVAKAKEAFQCWQAIHATNNAKAFVTALLLDRHWRRD